MAFSSPTFSPAGLSAVLTALALTAVLSGCSEATPTSTTTDPVTSAPASSSAASSASPSAAKGPSWGYRGVEGPEYWGELAAEFSACSRGEAQSPVDLPAAVEPVESDLVLSYADVDGKAVDTGYMLQINAGEGATVSYGDTEYTLQQVHYHDPSEHTIDSTQAPLEFHFVHQDIDGDLLVIGVLGVAGEHNESYEPFVDAANAGSTPEPTTVDMRNMMPASLAHFVYTGSLTTPPCSEGVQWLVMETPQELGQEQIDVLQARHDDNNRPMQPLNDREIRLAEH